MMAFTFIRSRSDIFKDTKGMGSRVTRPPGEELGTSEGGRWVFPSRDVQPTWGLQSKIAMNVTHHDITNLAEVV